MESEFLVIVASGNDLLLFQCQTDVDFQLDSEEQTSVKFQMKYKHFYSRKMLSSQ